MAASYFFKSENLTDSSLIYSYHILIKKSYFLRFFLQIGYFQTWLLYHNALSAGVAIEDILKHARKTKEMAGEEVITTLIPM